ncbi:YlzJ-like family protein [Pseudogracilibacillus sp. SO30301A]|uniref:YlzJ-like family protein n=1 Tax=Pseudogracilibacillus sp. SO30301A TaxID=3098291 RepID=UPI00300E2E95
MVHYTPLLTEEIFPQKEENHQLISWQGRSLYVKKTEQGQLEVVQLLSTDPQDFLNASFTPGTIFKK